MLEKAACAVNQSTDAHYARREKLLKSCFFFFFLLEGEKKREAQNPQIAALVCFNHEPTESVAYNIVLASSSQNKD